MAVDCLYSAYAARLDAAQNGGIDVVLSAAISQIRPILQWSLMVSVTAAGFAVAYGRMSADRLATWAVRALAVAWLIGGAAAYNQVVRNLFMTELPNWIATTVNGGGQQIQAAQQFCVLRAASENLVSQVFNEATGWSVAALGARVSAEGARWWQGICLEISFAIWLLGRRLMALALCMGPFLLCFELFQNTRGFVKSWIGTLVGLAAFQLASAIQLQFAQQGAMEFLRQLRGDMGGGLDAMTANLWAAAGHFLIDAITMFSIPTICAVGSGVAVQTAAGSQAVLNMVSKGARLGSTAAAKASGAGQAVRAAGGRMATAARGATRRA